MVSKLLSVIAERWQGSIRERLTDHLLRPIFINGVEVGFAHVRPDEENKKLSVRGVTIALWYFISRGHQAQALMPFCFKTYPNKSDNWNELMALFRMNLIEFTPGYGSDKYVEVNRIIAMRAREYGGCMVARSQMQSVVEEQPLLEAIVEKRLLIPSFNGNDLIFPVDGPLGRNGPNLSETLECTVKDPEFARCALQQMTLQDQRFWLSSLSAIASNMAGWTLLAEQIRGYQPKNVVIQSRKPAQQTFTSFHLHPPETNPPENRGFSVPRMRRWGQRHLNYGKSGQTDQSYHSYNYRRGGNSRERSLRYINTNLMLQSDERSRKSIESKNNMQTDHISEIRVNGYQNRQSEGSFRWYLAPHNSAATNSSRTSISRQQPQSTNEATGNTRYFTTLAAVFGWNKAKAICEKHPNVKNACVLAQLLLEEEEQRTAERQRRGSRGDGHRIGILRSDTSPVTGVGNVDTDIVSDQHEANMMINSSSNIQVERCPQAPLTHSESNISLDLISFAVPASYKPPEVLHGYVNDTHLGDSCPDLIEL
uniref:Ribonuclease ZC3H12D n=2 Tax=Ascaris TaxID=6251 RepID=F1KXX3_ASCSU